MEDYSNSALIAYPVLWPSYPPPDVPNLHSSLFFFEEAPDKQLLIDAIEAIEVNNLFIFANVYEADWFGEDSDVPVLKIRHNLLKKTYVSLAVELRMRDLQWDTT